MWGFRKFRELPAAPLGAATLVRLPVEQGRPRAVYSLGAREGSDHPVVRIGDRA